MIDREATGDAIRLSSSPVPISRILDAPGRWGSPFEAVQISLEDRADVFFVQHRGWIAPIGVEFGLLYAAFRRRFAQHLNEAVSWTLWTLEILLFLTAMLVNGAGAFSSVVSAVNLDTLSFAAIVERFGNLASTSQAALIMAVLSAFTIPIGTLVAGEGLAILVLESRTGATPHEARWQEVEFTVTYRALFVRYLQSGLPDREAKLKALADVKGYLTSARPSGVRALSAGNEQGGQASGQRPDSMKSVLCRYLDEHSDAEQLSVNQLGERLQLEGVRVGRTSVAKVLRERKQQVSA
jgi:hypothetical protein